MMNKTDDKNSETTKLQVLQSRAVQARIDIETLNLVDGNTFFDELEASQYVVAHTEFGDLNKNQNNTGDPMKKEILVQSSSENLLRWLLIKTTLLLKPLKLWMSAFPR